MNKVNAALLVSIALLQTGCMKAKTMTTGGVVTGAVAGGTIGYAVGKQFDAGLAGAVLGALAGGTIGGVVGSKMTKSDDKDYFNQPPIKAAVNT